MSAYQAAVLEVMPSGGAERGSYSGERLFSWEPDRAALEEIVGFEIDPWLWEFWDHPLAKHHGGLLPQLTFVHGPAGLLLYPPYLCFGYTHVPVERQIPVLNVAYPDVFVEIVAFAEDQSSLWVAAAGWFQEGGHPLQLSLEELFLAWTDALSSGELVAVDGRIESGPDVSAADPTDLDGAGRRAYASDLTFFDSAAELSLAAGGVVDELHDFDSWMQEGARLSADRIRRWEAAHGVLPFPKARGEILRLAD